MTDTSSIDREIANYRKVIELRGEPAPYLEAYLAGLSAAPGAANPYEGDAGSLLLGQEWKRGQQKARAARIPGFQELLDDIDDGATDDEYEALADSNPELYEEM